jgi:hypothetical protein
VIKNPPGEKSPHKKITKLALIILKKLVITLLPQKDICPQGRTYPKKEIIINIRKIIIPEINNFDFMKEKKKNPRNI